MKGRVLAILLAFGIYLTLSLAYLTLPGLQFDESLFAVAAFGDPQHSTEWRIQLGDRTVPVMLMPYLGALKAHLYTPLFALCGGGPETVRVPVIVVGMITLTCTYLLASSMFGRTVGTIALLLLASDPMFIFSNRLDWGPISLMMALKMTSAFLVWRWLGGAGTGSLAAACILMGLGLWDKVIFSWFVAALGIALAVCFRADVSARLTPRALLVACAAFMAGAAPLLAYNVAVPLGTFVRSKEVQHVAIAGDVRYRANLLRATLDGSAIPAMVNAEEPELLKATLSRRTGTPVDRLAGWLFRTFPTVRTFSFWTALGAFIAAIPLLFRPGTRRTRLLFIVVLVLMSACFLFVTPAARGPHHFVFLFPFTHVLTAVVISQEIRTGCLRNVVSSLATAVLLCSHLAAGAAFLKTVEVTGGVGNWSDAIYRLHEYVQARPDRPLFLMDWGFRNQLIALSGNKIRSEEVYLGNHPPERRVEAIYPYLLPASAMLVFHMPRYETNPTFDIFRQALVRYGLDARALQVFLQRNGHPVYALCEVVRPEIEAHTRSGRYFSYREAENTLHRRGGAVEAKPGASSGRMLGFGWGRESSDFVEYQFRLPGHIPDVRLYARYSYYSAGGRRCSIVLDGRQVATLEMPYNGGAEGSPEQWEWAETILGTLSPGEHVVKVVPLQSGPGINLDSFYLSQGILQLNPILPRAGPDPARPPLNLEVLGYQERPDVRLEVNSYEIVRGRSTLTLQLVNFPTRSIDVQYTLDGREMPLLYGWRLDENHRVSVPVDTQTRPGLYRYVAVKDSQDPSPASWIRVDVPILVK